MTRPPAQRRRDALYRLEHDVDVWVATASAGGGAPHLVPLSLVWLEDRVVIAVARSSVTARNLIATGSARLGAGPTRDVVMIDAVLERQVDVGADDTLGEAYASRSDWDPRQDEENVFLVLRPVRVQAWREVDELAGRTLMRGGRWLV